MEQSSNVIIDEIIALKNHIKQRIPGCTVIISSLVKRVDDGKAALTVLKFNDRLRQLKLDTINKMIISQLKILVKEDFI